MKYKLYKLENISLVKYNFQNYVSKVVYVKINAKVMRLMNGAYNQTIGTNSLQQTRLAAIGYHLKDYLIIPSLN